MSYGGGGGDEYKREESVALLVIVSLAALSLLSLIAAFAYYCYITRKVSRRLNSLNLPKRSSSPPPPLPPPPPPQGKESPSSNSASGGGAGSTTVVVGGERGVQVFSYRQLHAATGGFGRAHMVGQGSFGAVYRGVLADGRKVAVKLMDRPGKQGEQEFEMEVKISCISIESLHIFGKCWIFHVLENGDGNMIYSVLLRVSVGKYWILQYCTLVNVYAVQMGDIAGASRAYMGDGPLWIGIFLGLSPA